MMGQSSYFHLDVEIEREGVQNFMELYRIVHIEHTDVGDEAPPSC
jgi:hypothetical protein